MKLPIHEVRRPSTRRTGLRGEYSLASHDPANPDLPHQPRRPIPTEHPPLTHHKHVHLAGPGDTIVLSREALDLHPEDLVRQRPRRWRTAHSCAGAAAGDEPTNPLAQYPADGLDPETTLVFTDEPDNRAMGRSSP